MANEEQLQRLKEGTSVWNAWRQAHPAIQIDLSGVDLNGKNLRGINLSRADLSGAALRGADFIPTNLQRANLEGANLERADLREANLGGADLKGAFLAEADLNGADLNGANLSPKDSTVANLIRANLEGANLRGAFLWEVNFSLANLTNANLDSATLTDACLWETQRAGWSIQGIICEAVYWDSNRQERTTYKPGEFERLLADTTKIVLHYEKGISRIEIATLPALIQRLEASHPGCILRLQFVEEAPGGAMVTLVAEDVGQGNVADLAGQLQKMAKQLQAVQRYALEQADVRRHAEYALEFLSDKFFPKLLERAMGQSGNQYNIGSIGGDFVADVHNNARVNLRSTVTHTTNDLTTIEALVSNILIHRAELSLNAPQRTQLETQLNAIKEQLAAKAPNHTRLREALHTVRHLLEAGFAHTAVAPLMHPVVGPWLHTLGILG